MGGIYGNCAATALEDAPPEARGILSGMLQQGYAFGYLLATVFARALAHNPKVCHFQARFASFDSLTLLSSMVGALCSGLAHVLPPSSSSGGYSSLRPTLLSPVKHYVER
jgi:hypothetical protein